MGKLLSWALALGPGGCVFTHTHTRAHTHAHRLLPQDRSCPETAAWLFFFPSSELVLFQTLLVKELESAVRAGSLPTALRAEAVVRSTSPTGPPAERGSGPRCTSTD